MMKKIVFYLSRILSILIVLFFGAFILEAFNPFTWQALISQSILPAIFLMITIISWKSEKMGGLLFCIGGLISFFFFHPFLWNGFWIGLPLLLTGILFLFQKK